MADSVELPGYVESTNDGDAFPNNNNDNKGDNDALHNHQDSDGRNGHTTQTRAKKQVHYSLDTRNGDEKTMTHLPENGATSNGATSNGAASIGAASNGIMKDSYRVSPAMTQDEEAGLTCTGSSPFHAISYINTKAGILKLLQTLFGVIVLGCASGTTVTNASGSALFFLLFVALLSTLNALFSLLYFEYYGAPEKRGLEMGETLFNGLSSILNFIAAFVFLLTVTIDDTIPGDGITVATLVFAWILFFLYLINFVICVQIQKQKSQRISSPKDPKQPPPQYKDVKY